MTKIILVRHGQTFWNLELKYQGHTDIALTETGRTQASLLADRLLEEAISAVYASDLSRAYDTASAIAQQHGKAVVAIPELREISFGDWEGLSYDKINSTWPDLMTKMYSDPDEVRIPGGETFTELMNRAYGAIERLVAVHSDETIVVASHGGTIRTILCAALGIPLKNVWNIRQDNTAVNIIEYYSDRTMVSLVNDTHHLKVLT